MKKIFALLIIGIVSSACSQLKVYAPVPPEKATDFFRVAWAYNLDPLESSGNLPIALQSPYIYDGIVYVGDNRGTMNAYELENGRPVFSVHDGATYHAAPVVYKNKLIYGTVSGRVIARNIKNGEEIYYNVDLGASIETAGTIYQGKIFFQLRNHQVYCLDVETGKIIWGFKKSISSLTTVQRASTPVIFNNRLYVGFADGTISALSIEEGVVLFEVKLSNSSKFVDVDVSPVFVDDKLYVSSIGSEVYSMNAMSGKILRKADFQSLRRPMIVGDELYYGTTTGELVVCDKNLNIKSRTKISDTPLMSMVLFKSNLVIGTLDGKIIAFNKEHLKVKSTFEFGHAYSAIFSDIVAMENRLVVLSSRNRLFSFY